MLLKAFIKAVVTVFGSVALFSGTIVGIIFTMNTVAHYLKDSGYSVGWQIAGGVSVLILPFLCYITYALTKDFYKEISNE